MAVGTEPLEFSFMFLSPLLYGIHAVLTGISMALMNILGVKLGFTFSAGAFDYGLSYGLSTRGWMLLPVGAIYFALYYFIFRWAILRFDLKVPGRDEAPKETADTSQPHSDESRGGAYINALGGAANIQSLGACTTRLRLVVNNQEQIDEAALKSLGASGVLKLKGGNTQVVVGPIADSLVDDLRAAMRTEGVAPEAKTSPLSPAPSSSATSVSLSQEDVLPEEQRQVWLNALGGANNLRTSSAVAHTRLRIELWDNAHLDTAALNRQGVAAIQHLASGAMHLIFADAKMPAMLAQGLNNEHPHSK